VYQLVAFIGDDINPTSVAEFTTDHRGSYKVSYVKNSKNIVSGSRRALPNVLNPLCNVRELNIVNGSAETVLRSFPTNPDRPHYLAKTSMFNTGIIHAAGGELQISATSRSTRFRLKAIGMTPSASYLLTINGTIVQTSVADSNGKFSIAVLPEGTPNGLDIQTVSLTDATGTNVVLISGGLGAPCSTAVQVGLNIGTLTNFAVLAGSEVTSTGNTIVNGDVGVWAGSSVSGFLGIVPGGPGVVNGTIHAGDSAAQIAQGELTTAYNDLAGRTLAPIDVANADLGGMTLVPGLYKSTGTLALTGTVTLDAQGNANGVFIFQVASSLDTATGSQVVLSGGAKASNVFWQVGTSATLATTTVFKGTIMADQSITLANGATLEGRALARIAAVTMDANIITIPAP
jgi:hypothetical protein